MLKSKILVAGVGNPYRHDDGFGLEIIKILRKENNPNLDLFSSGTDGFSLLDQLSSYKRAIIIDAVCMGANPGRIKLFTPKEAKLQIKRDALSTHGFGLAEILKLADGLNVKTKIKIIGIEPQDVGFGEGLSEVIKSQIPTVLDLIKTEVK